MKNMRKCFKYLYCFNTLSANKIEIIIISLSSVGSILTIIGLAVIHWKYTSKVMKVFQVLSLIFYFLLIGISSFFLYFRKKNNINKYITISLFLCFLELFLSIFSIFISLFTAIGALPDLKKNNKREVLNDLYPSENNDNEENTGDYLVSNGEFSYAIIYLIINLFIWMVLLLLCISDLIRIKLGINGSYVDYLNENKNEENIKKDININSLNSMNNKFGYPVDKKEEEKLYDKYGEKKENGMNTSSIKKLNNDIKNNITNNSFNLYDVEQKNTLKYSYKEKFVKEHTRNKNYCNSVDDIHKSKIANQKYDKEKYLEKYLEGYGANPYYSNFGNKSFLNVSTMNNSINPG